MKLKTSHLAGALQIANLAIERRNTIPILGHALIADRPDGFEVRGNNLDQEITVVGTREPGETAFRPAAFPNPAALAKVITAGGADTIRLNPRNGKIALLCGELDGSVSTLPAEDFPRINMSEAHSFEAELGLAAIDMILLVSGAMSSEETRYYLNGVYFHHVEGWTYRAVATDGHRLYTGTIELPNAAGQVITGQSNSGGVIVPKQVIKLLRQLRPRMDKDQPVRFAVGGTVAPNMTTDLAAKASTSMSSARLSFRAQGFDIQLITKLIDGTFPDYQRVIPQIADDQPQVVFKRADLRRALDGITAGSGEKSHPVKLTFTGDKLIVSSKWVDLGFEGKIAIPARSRIPRGPFEIGYNGTYLRAVTDASPGEELVITAADAAAPGSIVDPAASDFRTVLMPMRV